MPGHTEYNAKARRSTAGTRKKGKSRAIKGKSNDQIDDIDTNVEVIVPKNAQERELGKREKMREELRAQSDSWTSKKRKRLEKYIDKKLKKEERTLVFEKLAQSQTGVNYISLQSSSTLGSGIGLTHGERLGKDEDLQLRRAMQGGAGKRRRHSGIVAMSHAIESSEDEDEVPSDSDLESDKPNKQPTPVLDAPVVIGSALRRNKDGAIVPLALRRKSKKTEIRKWNTSRYRPPTDDAETSFDSSDSAFDPILADEKDPLASDRQPKRRKTSENMRGPLGEDLVFPSTTFAHQILEKERAESGRKLYVKTTAVNRPPDVEEARLLLPIVGEEQPIMEAIMFNLVVIICGETGSGKTTQVPQFLYEAGFGKPGGENPGMIGITQPRRVAAISMANRVAHELALTSSEVSYQIRYDTTVSPLTTIKFMTDGVLLRELATDFLLNKYSILIIDEAHERSINTDILIGVLSRVIKLREKMWKEGLEGAKPLRLVIMSATLRVSDFAENKNLFPEPPPVINVEARQHPVTIHFSRRTSPDYVVEVVKKASKIHSRLPPGGILIFLTGQNEITGVCKRLEELYGRRALQQGKDSRETRRTLTEQYPHDDHQGHQKSVITPTQVDLEAEDVDFDVENGTRLGSDIEECINDADEGSLESDVDDGRSDDLGIDTETEVPMHVVPLYSLLPGERQMDVFKLAPADTRLVVVATNIAETSLTIPGIKYVIDCGRVKERRYDVANGVQAFQVTWISKASAAQRAGRAGRTGPGHCYRLYSSALFEQHFQQFNPPEILRAPIEGVVLQMKNMHIDAVVNFPFPTPPDRFALQQAEKILIHLGALSPSPNEPANSRVTDLGRTMALFPLSPRYSRMLAAGQQHQCLPYVIAIVSAMSVGDPFLHEEAIGMDDDSQGSSNEDLPHLSSESIKAKHTRQQRRKTFFKSQHKHASLADFTSDVLKILSVVGAYEYQGGGAGFCSDQFVSFKIMEEIHKLRAQITNIMRLYFPGADVQFSPKLNPPSQIQMKVLKQLVTAAFIDQVAVRKDLVDKNRGSQYSDSRNIPYRAIGIPEDVFLHPSSVLSYRPPPDYIVFQEVVRTARNFVKGVTVTNVAWLSSLGKPLCTFSKPFRRTDGVLMVTPRFGPEGWELPPIRAEKLCQI